MSVLSDAMRLSIAVSSETQLLPGTRVSFKDPEAPLPDYARIKGTVSGLVLYFDGERLTLDGVVVAFDSGSPGYAHAALADRSEIFQQPELDQLEILP